VSSIDIYALLEKFRLESREPSHPVIDALVDRLRQAERSGYFGTLYRTDFEVEGSGEFPVDMLRYTCSWPKGEINTQAIEDSFEDRFRRRTITLSKYHRDPEPQLAADRWEAKFRWRVVRVIETVPI
jgi:hypothetical protein